MKEILSKKNRWHLSVFFVSIIFSLIIIAIIIITFNEKKSEVLASKYASFSFKSYYPRFQVDSNEPFHALRHTLESGEVALFGSSELSNHESHFIPYNFLSKVLGVKLRAFGHAGFQEKAIITEILSVLNPKVLDNGRVVIMISPTWFLDGKNMHEGLWGKEVASSIILSRIRENKFLDKKTKEFLLGEDSELHFFHVVDKFLSKVVDNNFMLMDSNGSEVLSPPIFPEWKKWKKESQAYEKSITSNNYGINDKYYDQHIKPVIETSKFPFKLNVQGSLATNKEIQDFDFLLEMLSVFKHKPLFIILPLNKKSYKNLDVLNPTITYLEEEIRQKNYPLLNFWYLPYEQGVLTDVMHTGEYGWVLINEFIYENYFHQ